MKSEKSFVCLYRFLFALFILEIIVGVAIVIVCEYVKQLVNSRIFQLDKHEILNVFFVVKLFGLHVSFYFLCGLPLIFLFNDPYTFWTGFTLKLWVLLAVETAFGALFMIWCFIDTSKYLIESFEVSLVEGIKLYPTDPLWVLIWDDLQYDFQCCGVYGHTDWMKINLTMSSRDFRQTNKFSWLPYSCANGNVPTKTSLTDENIHTNGCFSVMSNITNYVTVSIVSLHASIIVLLVIETLSIAEKNLSSLLTFIDHHHHYNALRFLL
jgi:Tetraspanin family